MRIGSVVIACYEFDAMLAFWATALGYVPREPATSGWVVLTDPGGRGPNVSLNRVPTRKKARSRLHLEAQAMLLASPDNSAAYSTTSISRNRSAAAIRKPPDRETANTDTSARRPST